MRSVAKDAGDIVDDVTRKVRVLSEKCSTCIFWPGNRMHLSEGYLQDIIRGNVEVGSLLTCHQTLPYGDFPDFGSAACRGFWESHGQNTVAGIMAKYIIGITEVDPPRKGNNGEQERV